MSHDSASASRRGIERFVYGFQFLNSNSSRPYFFDGVHEMYSPDEDLESVFKYLVAR